MSGGYDPMIYFLYQDWRLPYTIDGQCVLSAHSKTGLAMSRNGSVVHRVAAAAVTFSRRGTRFAARWWHGGGCKDVILLATADGYGGLCLRCKAAEEAKPGVYRCFSASGELLYIGSSRNWQDRLTSHRLKSRWWSEVDDVQFQAYPTLIEARLAERLAIEAESPARNVRWRAS